MSLIMPTELLGVAHGQWRLTEFAENGRGLIVEVPGSLVESATGQCNALAYTGADNCTAIDSTGQGMVTVATAAGLYNPVWYAVIGYPSILFEGSSALYVMRLVSALLCACGVALAAWSLALTNPGRWTRLGFIVALTPILIYSTVIPAPNGPEMVAGLLLWTTLLALLQTAPKDRHHPTLFGAACVAAIILANLRTLGPMWLGIIFLSLVGFVGIGALLASLRTHPLWWIVSTVLTSAGVFAGAWWSVTAGLTDDSPDIAVDRSAELTFGLNPVVWLLQMIAAFPLRDGAASPAVYLCLLGVLAFLIITGVAKSRGRVRATLVLMVLVVVFLPIVLTALTFQSQGVIWQGRYQLPWAVGVVILAGVALDERDFLPREGAKVTVILSVLVALAHAWSVWGLAAGEQQRPISADDGSWVTASPAALATVCFVTVVILAVLVSRLPTAETEFSEGKTLSGTSRGISQLPDQNRGPT